MKFLFLIALVTMACSPSKTDRETKQKQTVKVTNTKTVAPAANVKKAPVTAKPVAKPNAKSAAGDARYVIQFPPSKKGTETTVRVLPLGDYKMNLEYPASLNLDGSAAPAGLAGKQKQPSELTEARLNFVLPLEKGAASMKDASIKATIDFSVCNAQACEMIEKEITWKVKSGS